MKLAYRNVNKEFIYKVKYYFLHSETKRKPITNFGSLLVRIITSSQHNWTLPKRLTNGQGRENVPPG